MAEESDNSTFAYPDQLQQLIEMGFDKQQSMDLLLDNDGDINKVLQLLMESNHKTQKKEDIDILNLLNNTSNDLIAFPHFDKTRIDYRMIQKGDGKTYPDPFGAVHIKYTGYKYNDCKQWERFTSKDISNTVFETNLGNHENMIGIEQAVLSMSKDEVAMIWIPSRLGYGEYGAEPHIPPNTDLLFKFTLIDISQDPIIVNNDDADENTHFITKFNNEWNQSSFDNIYDTITSINGLQQYPLEILICISNFAMDALFPHKDKTKIDIRRIKCGDSKIYPDPFAAVDIKYTGYKYNNCKEWEQFTTPNISNTIFETRLGNHENIIGLEQAVLSMSKGEIIRVWMPSRLAYGSNGAEPLLPPNTDLVFELSLIEVRNEVSFP